MLCSHQRQRLLDLVYTDISRGKRAGEQARMWEAPLWGWNIELVEGAWTCCTSCILVSCVIYVAAASRCYSTARATILLPNKARVRNPEIGCPVQTPWVFLHSGSLRVCGTLTPTKKPSFPLGNLGHEGRACGLLRGRRQFPIFPLPITMFRVWGFRV